MLLMTLFVAIQAATAPPPAGPVAVMRTPTPPAVTGTDSCLPLKYSESMPVIEGSVAGRKVHFGFDTGAPGGPHLSQAIVQELKLPQIGEVRATDPSLRNLLTIPLHELRNLKVGNLTVAQWTATARPAAPSRRIADPDGIIGLTAFAGFVVTIDYPGNRLLLTKGRLPEPDGKSSFKYSGPIPRVPLSIDGKPIEAHLDTGNSRYPLILPEAFALGLPKAGARFPIGVARTVNNSFNLMALPVGDARVGDLPLYSGTAAYPGPSPVTGNIGSPLLKDFIVKVDPANGIVALERAKPGLENGCPNA